MIELRCSYFSKHMWLMATLSCHQGALIGQLHMEGPIRDHYVDLELHLGVVHCSLRVIVIHTRHKVVVVGVDAEGLLETLTLALARQRTTAHLTMALLTKSERHQQIKSIL